MNSQSKPMINHTKLCDRIVELHVSCETDLNRLDYCRAQSDLIKVLEEYMTEHEADEAALEMVGSCQIALGQLWFYYRNLQRSA